MTHIPEWAKSISSQTCFEEEQAQLSRVWTFLGYVHQVRNEQDWFVAQLAGRSVMVQRFGEHLRGFENICPHRYHPIRTVTQGNSPMVCPFHQWRFDAEGCARGIPKCQQIYGKSPAALNAKLNPIEIAQCGGLIFGRFGSGPTLEAWLGEAYDILSLLTIDMAATGKLELSVRAHWKQMMHVSLDDYHIVAVHPDTFGKKGFLRPAEVQYYRIGDHSAFIPHGQPDSLQKMAAHYRQTLTLNAGYIIFQCFPTLVLPITPPFRLLGDEYRYLLVEHMIPEAHDRTLMRTDFFFLPFARPAGFFRRWLRWQVRLVMDRIMVRNTLKIHQEDNVVCENIQRVAHQIQGDMVVSNQETRISWFEEAYAKFVKFGRS